MKRPSLRRGGGVVLASLLFIPVLVAQSVSISTTSGLTFVTGTNTARITFETGPPSGPYVTYSSRITLSQRNSTMTGTTSTSSTISTTSSSTSSENATATDTGAQPSNTQPCNNHVEFCTRKYSNITMVGAHNSPFVRPGNSASNQELPVQMQLDDGIRFLQAQIRWPNNGTQPHFCHTNCDILDVGPIADWLGQVRSWVDRHPSDVVTILLGNGNFSDPSLYVPYIERSGILRYAYEAPFLPMSYDDWPTLGEMIADNKRVVMFMDYNTNQARYPWLLDEFSQMWETPFSPQDRNFPCNAQRPPGLQTTSAQRRMYLMNHNLNVQFDVFGSQILAPAVSLLNETNAPTGFGSVGLAANNCLSDWGHPPLVLNVDYYNYGSRPGSVFEVAALMNNVTYNGTCCGLVSAAPADGRPAWAMALAAAGPMMMALVSLLW